MKTHNLNHFSTYKILIKLLLLLTGSFLHGCSGEKQAQQVLPTHNQVSISDSAININTASLEQLESLPHVGAGLAEKIVEYREKYGKFRRVEHLLLLDGISDSQFRELKNLIKVE